MSNIYIELNKSIEKIISLRINEIIEKSNLNEKITNKIKDVNNIIVKDNKTIKNKKIKRNIVEKEHKKLSIYTTFVKDANNIIKNNPYLNYLPNDIVSEIKKLKEKSAKDQFKELGSIWKKLDNNIINKYKELTKDKDFTNEKYNNIVGKVQTPKTVRKKKSKESLH